MLYFHTTHAKGSYRIRIMSIDIRRTQYSSLLSSSKRPQERGDESLDRSIVVSSKINRITPPAFGKVPGTLHSFRILAGVGERDFVAAVGFPSDGAVSHHGFAEMVGLAVGQEDVLAAVEGLLNVGDGEVLEVHCGEGVLAAEYRCWDTLAGASLMPAR